MTEIKRVTFFDFEATSLHTDEARIASIGAVTVAWPPGLSPDLLQELSSFERKLTIDPQLASPEALAVMRYSAEAWADAVQPYLALKAFAHYLTEAHGDGPVYLGGHFVLGYDLRILHREWRRHVARDVELPWLRVVQDSCDMALHHDWRGNRPWSFRLAQLHKHFFGTDVPEHHDALADARASARVAAALELGWTREGGAQ